METFTRNEDTLTFTNRKGQGSEMDVDIEWKKFKRSRDSIIIG